MGVKDNIYNVLKGKFLVSDDSFKNWRFILFVVGLMLLIIASSHSADKKVMEIARLNKEINEKRAEFVDTRTIFMEMKLESTIRNKVVSLDLKPSENPPQVIKVVSKKVTSKKSK
ncbi:FtsL-like putative cell division protein [Lutibacter sp.]|jgi:type II secretory pathway component PulL|uniref:FtsL-like putative cell division protein n=1 Tax=Lutibacter sp. TaxID=1925666 RepID=UPI001A1963CC|nr:FtsL-like putative cell division protein [Lutibacter sp.]MBI9041611.1 S-adenosyl-methyltransferase [Lutibacter sp.]